MSNEYHGMLKQKIGKGGRITYLKYSKDLKKFISHNKWDANEMRRELWGDSDVKAVIRGMLR